MNYERYKYSRYMPSNQESRWATIEEIQNAGTYLNLNDEVYTGAGIPLLSNGKEAYVDNKDTHTLIFGATGSKKTRLFCMPMINIFAKAGESFMKSDGITWPLFYTMVYYLLFVGLLTLLFNWLEKKLDYFK